MTAPLRCLLLCLLLLLLAFPAVADEWNDNFSQPRRYRVLRDIAVRNGPGNSHQRLGSVAKDDVVRVHQIVNGWHQFMYNGHKGWIFKRYLRPMAAGEGEQRAISAEPSSEKPQQQDNAVEQALEELQQEPAPQEEQAPLAHLIFDDNAGQDTEATHDAPQPPATKTPQTSAQESPSASAAATAPDEGSEDADSQNAAPESAASETDTGPQKKSAPQPEPQTEANAESEPEPLPEEDTPPQEEPAPHQQEPDPSQVAAIEPEPKPDKPRAPLRELSKADIADCERFISLQPGLKSGQASFQGSLKAGQNACFRILALEGWTLEVTLDSSKDSARFDVFTPTQGRTVATMKAWAHPIERSGDKQIVVYSNEATRYTLGIQLR